MSPCTQYLPTGNYFVNLQDIYQKVNDQYSYGMNIHEVRRDNLARLIKERFEGKQRRLADAIDRQPDYISRILKGTKNVGEAFARHVERSVGLNEGALDIQDPTAGDAGFLSQSVKYIHEHSRGIDKRQPDELEFFGHMDAWDSKTPLDEDEVELPLFREVELAAGAGATQVIENCGAKLRFAKSTLRRAGVPPESAGCAFVRGNSMERIMPDGTCVGVNTADRDIRDGEIYAIDHSGMLRVKYLYRRPGGGLKIVSENDAEHPPEEISGEDAPHSVKVIGRVFWWSVLR